MQADLLFLPNLESFNGADKNPHASRDGKLEIKFKTGQIQMLHLRGILLRPMIVVSPEEYE